MTTFVLTDTGRNAACDGFVDALDTGTGTEAEVRIITSATHSPANATLVAIGLGATAFGPAATGVATQTNATNTGTATDTGTAAKFQLLDQSNNILASGDVGTSGATMTISNTSIATTTSSS